MGIFSQETSYDMQSSARAVEVTEVGVGWRVLLLHHRQSPYLLWFSREELFLYDFHCMNDSEFLSSSCGHVINMSQATILTVALQTIGLCQSSESNKLYTLPSSSKCT
jgi:hypothetical protein